MDIFIQTGAQMLGGMTLCEDLLWVWLVDFLELLTNQGGGCDSILKNK